MEPVRISIKNLLCYIENGVATIFYSDEKRIDDKWDEREKLYCSSFGCFRMLETSSDFCIVGVQNNT